MRWLSLNVRTGSDSDRLLMALTVLLESFLTEPVAIDPGSDIESYPRVETKRALPKDAREATRSEKP